jgi:hypothetical protein
MQSKTDIGFGKKVRGVWLDSALEHAAAGRAFEEVKAELAGEIAANNPGPEAIRKILTPLKRVWFTPPDFCQALRDGALQLFRHNPSAKTRLLLNWGMAIASYPFIGSVAEVLGRLLKLQGEARLADVQRRVREQLGDRDFVGRITRYDVSSFVDWGVITEAGKKGTYVAGKQVRPDGNDVVAWLAEALLISRGKAQMPLSEFSRQPILFPINMDAVSSAALRNNRRLRVARHSHNEDVVFLESPFVAISDHRSSSKPAPE